MEVTQLSSMSIKSQSRLFVMEGFEIADDVPSSTRGDLDGWVDIDDCSEEGLPGK